MTKIRTTQGLCIKVEQHPFLVLNVSNRCLRNVNERKACKVTCCLVCCRKRKLRFNCNVSSLHQPVNDDYTFFAQLLNLLLEVIFSLLKIHFLIEKFQHRVL